MMMLSGCGAAEKPAELLEKVNPDVSSLVIEEHAVCSASVDAPDHFEFRERIPANVLALREGWRVPGSET
ncbi:MAG: hypothetical protein JW925_12255, partial [Syntrophaceae bacterium]|nr:hypothetical protein [Syntrophaceae bacterium]